MKIIGINQSTENGERNIAAVLEYPQRLSADYVDAGCFAVEGRSLLDAYVSDEAGINTDKKSCNGCYVVLMLDAWQKEAETFPLMEQVRRMPQYTIRQTRELAYEDGTAYPAWTKPKRVTEMRNDVTDKFQSWVYYDAKMDQEIDYSLYVPVRKAANERYPLVIYWHGMHENGDKSLLHSLNATIWTLPEEQKERPCYVLVPKCPPDTVWISRENGEPTGIFEAVCELIQIIMKRESIDELRIYGIGYDMGGMAALECLKHYPDLFAASLVLAGWCRNEGLEVLADQKIWMFGSEDDGRVLAKNLCILNTLMEEGATVNRAVWDGSLRGESAEDQAWNQLLKDGNIKQTIYKKDSIKNECAHEDGWKPAVTNAVIRRWLFAQKKVKVSSVEG